MSTLRSVSPPTLAALFDRARAWPVESQQVSRRNAMIACTALAQRRAEHQDVDEFFADRILNASPHAEAAHG